MQTSRSSKGFFVPRGVRKVEGVINVRGDLIVPGVRTDDPDGSGGSSKFDLPKLPGPFEVKWILPPANSPNYGRVKAFAEGMGYETVEHDDFSYPGDR